jgi:hypothetical protein
VGMNLASSESLVCVFFPRIPLNESKFASCLSQLPRVRAAAFELSSFEIICFATRCGIYAPWIGCICKAGCLSFSTASTTQLQDYIRTEA